MTASNYRPLGQLIGNSPDSQIRSDAPVNVPAFGYPVTQPTGAVALAAGEGATAQAWNRFVSAAAMNADRLYAGGHAKPIAVPMTLTATEAADLGSVAAAAVDLTPGGTFDGWVYHGTSGGAVGKYFRLLDSDGTPSRTSAGALIEVTDVQYLDTSAAVGTEKTLHTTAVVGPATTADARHKLILTAAPSASAMVASATPMFGCIVRIHTNSVVTAAKGTNNGRYRIADGLGNGTEFKLVEYRHRIRVHTIGGAALAAGQTVTGTNSGASFVIGAGVDDIYADYVEFDSITPGPNSKVFGYGEPITSSGGATATLIAYTAPGDPVVLNNDVVLPGTAVIKSDGSFSRLVQLILSGIPGSSSTKLLACGGKGAALNTAAGALAMSHAAGVSGGGAGLVGLDGIYQRSDAPSASGLAGNPNAAIVAVTITAGGPFTVSEVLYETTSGRRFATVLQVDSSTRLVIAAHGDLPSSFPTGITGASSATTANLTAVILVRGRDIIVDSGAPIYVTGSQLLDLRSSKSALRVLMASDALRNTGISVQGGSSTPASGNAAAIEVREPLTSVTYSVDAEEPVSYAWGGAFFTLTFSGTDLTTFFSTALLYWDSAHIAIEVSGATHPALNGVYAVEVPTATTVRLRLIDNSGYATEGTATAGGYAVARFFGRRVTAFGINSDGGSILDLFMTAGNYRGLTLRRKGATANSTLMQVQDATTNLLLVKADVAAGTSDESEYVEIPTLHTDFIRSSTDKRTAGTDGTRYIDLSGTETFAFLMSPAGGAGADVDVVTFEDGVFTFRPNALTGTPALLSLEGTTDGAALLLDDQHSLWSDPNAGTPLLRLMSVVGGVDRAMATLKYVQNQETQLYLHSPTFAAGTEQPIASGDKVQLLFTDLGEVVLEARGTATPAEPDVILRIGAAGVLATGYADGGSQSFANTSGNKPILAVPDIKYGAHSSYYPGYVGKLVKYMVPLTGGTEMDNTATRYWTMQFGFTADIGGFIIEQPETALLMGGEAAAAEHVIGFALPPLAQGSAGEEGLKWFQSVVATTTLWSIVDSIEFSVYMSGPDTKMTRVSEIIPRVGTIDTFRSHTIRPRVTGTAAAGGGTTITLATPVLGTDQSSWQSGVYVGWAVTIYGGTGAGQSRVITAYNGTTKVVTVSAAWTTPPNGTSVYVLTPTPIVSGHYEHAGTSVGATATTITLDAGATTEYFWFVGQYIYIVSGPGSGDSRVIVGYDGATKEAIVNAAWSTNPTASVYGIGALELAAAADRQFFLKVKGLTASTSTQRPLAVHSIAVNMRTTALVPAG